PVAEAPPVAPGTLQHAAAALRGRGASGPAELIAALTAVLQVHRSELRSEPAVCARILFSIITSTTHTPFASADGLTSHEIVEVFLNGVRTRPTTPETPC
ncbi:MAG: hypothetical protein HGA44_10745, partial [Cellulomonadaceae bacterium]|nr:hypothetical protein [Cellulomonadaceae bacterium]